MGRPRNPNRGMVVAKEAVVIVVGARPATYERITVVSRRTGERVEMDSDRIDDPGDEGVQYGFKPYQRVARTHPAVLQSPHHFMDIEELDESELEMVHT